MSVFKSPWIVAHQAHLCMEFSRQDWSGIAIVPVFPLTRLELPLGQLKLPVQSLVLKEASPCLFTRQQCFNRGKTKLQHPSRSSLRSHTASLPPHFASQSKSQSSPDTRDGTVTTDRNVNWRSHYGKYYGGSLKN